MGEDKTEESIEIRFLPSDQWIKYKELRLRALKKEPQAFASSYERESAYPDEKWRQRLEESGKGKSWLLFAVNSDGDLVGMIGGYRDDKDVSEDSVQIYGVYVDEEMRGKGIGKLLMSSILKIFRDSSDIQIVKLEVNSDQISAKKLYEHLGFKEYEKNHLVLGDGKEHTISKMILTSLK